MRGPARGNAVALQLPELGRTSLAWHPCSVRRLRARRHAPGWHSTRRSPGTALRPELPAAPAAAAPDSGDAQSVWTSAGAPHLRSLVLSKVPRAVAVPGRRQYDQHACRTRLGPALAPPCWPRPASHEQPRAHACRRGRQASVGGRLRVTRATGAPAPAEPSGPPVQRAPPIIVHAARQRVAPPAPAPARAASGALGRGPSAGDVQAAGPAGAAAATPAWPAAGAPGRRRRACKARGCVRACGRGRGRLRRQTLPLLHAVCVAANGRHPWQAPLATCGAARRPPRPPPRPPPRLSYRSGRTWTAARTRLPRPRPWRRQRAAPRCGPERWCRAASAPQVCPLREARRQQREGARARADADGPRNAPAERRRRRRVAGWSRAGRPRSRRCGRGCPPASSAPVRRSRAPDHGFTDAAALVTLPRLAAGRPRRPQPRPRPAARRARARRARAAWRARGPPRWRRPAPAPRPCPARCLRRCASSSIIWSAVQPGLCRQCHDGLRAGRGAIAWSHAASPLARAAGGRGARQSGRGASATAHRASAAQAAPCAGRGASSASARRRARRPKVRRGQGAARAQPRGHAAGARVGRTRAGRRQGQGGARPRRQAARGGRAVARAHAVRRPGRRGRRPDDRPSGAGSGGLARTGVARSSAARIWVGGGRERGAAAASADARAGGAGVAACVCGGRVRAAGRVAGPGCPGIAAAVRRTRLRAGAHAAGARRRVCGRPVRRRRGTVWCALACKSMLRSCGASERAPGPGACACVLDRGRTATRAWARRRRRERGSRSVRRRRGERARAAHVRRGGGAAGPGPSSDAATRQRQPRLWCAARPQWPAVSPL